MADNGLRHFYRRWLSAICLTAFCLTAGASLPAYASTDRYSGVISRVQKLQRSGAVSTAEIGRSAEDRPIYAVVFAKSGQPEEVSNNNPRILVITGQHGNEEVPVYATLDLMEDMAEGNTNLPDSVLDNVVVVFVPVVNPDGFAAKKRCNALGIDLNRNWNEPDQPETVAVSRMIEKFRPIALIDQHEWSAQDPHKPNCIEVVGFGETAEQRLAGTLASTACKGLPLALVRYHKESDPRLAHRHFMRRGICSVLVETSPESPELRRTRLYNKIVMSILTEVAIPSSPGTARTIAQLQQKETEPNLWLQAVCAKRGKSAPGHGKSANWPAVCLAMIGALVAWATRSSNSSRQSENEWKAEDIRKLHIVAITDLIQSDLPPSDKLALMQQYRTRPTDRPRTPAAQPR